MKEPGTREALKVSQRIAMFVGVLIALCLATGPGDAQTLDETKLGALFKLNLGHTDQDMLEEYLDILEDLQDILSDYGDYMEDSDPDGVDHRVASFTRLRRNLDDGAYNSDPEKLFDDIYETVDDIKAIESKHRVKFNTNSPRCCRLPRSLRKELVIVAELVEDYSEMQSESLVSRHDIDEYMDAAQEYLKVLEDYEALAELDGDALRELEESLKSLGLAERIQFIIERAQHTKLSDMPHVLVVPEMPDVPDVPPIPRPPNIVRKPEKHGRVGAARTISGVISVSNSSNSIILENPTGDIAVTGADVDEITAQLLVEVAASSHSKERQYLDQVTLAVNNDNQHYFVTVDLPRLSDHRTDLLNSALIVTVPQSNRLVCKSSFGQVEISGIAAAISVDGKNSKIKINGIDGDIDVENSNGSISLRNVAGRIRVQNAYGPINLTECTGSMVIENEYNLVRLLRCEGRLEITNTGQIEVIDHEGDIEIENAYGEVEIEDIDGSVVVRNGYQPLIVSGVSGSAELENGYGEISAENIGGSLIAATTNGPIYVEGLDGPVDLSNDYGNISITLGSDFRGGSTISNTGGTVKIAFTTQPDLILDIFTDGGTISSNLPISVHKRGNSKTAELILGDGGQVLELIGNNTAVIIKGR